MNDKQREQWVDNDEGLYNLWKASGLSKKEFVKQNREFITNCTEKMMCGKRQSHYLVYG
jgi:hypothetical protein